MKEEIKPCPFCGGTMTSYAAATKNEAAAHHGQTVCDKCGAQGPDAVSTTEAGAVRFAIAKSNTRAFDPAVQALIDAAEALSLAEDPERSCPTAKHGLYPADTIKRWDALRAALAAVKEGK